MKMPWELLNILADQLDSDSDGDEDDWQELEYQQDSQQRLLEMDLITRNMTQDEYMDYSECRQASFTYKKSKRFRDFINLGAHMDMKPSDDIIEILGFLGCEIVSKQVCIHININIWL